MTKWICNGCLGTPCRLDIGVDSTIVVPTKCVRYQVSPCWERDCTTDEKKDELPEGIDWRMTTHYNAKRITELDKKVQELEQMLQNHIHYIAGTTGKSAWREK